VRIGLPVPVLIEPLVLRWRHDERISIENWRFSRTGSVCQKCLVEVVVPPPILPVNKLSERFFKRYKNVCSILFRFVTMHVFDGQKNGQTDGQQISTSRPCVCIRSRTAKG